MKMYHLILVLMFSASALTAEEVIVYRCVTSFPTPKPGSEAESSKAYTAVGEELGKIETGKEALWSIFETRRKTSWQGEPFYGPVEKYVFKDSKGKLYVAHFEFQEGHKTFGKGIRFAILPLTKVKGAKDKYEGSPYDGASVIDVEITKQLKALARLKPSHGKNQ